MSIVLDTRTRAQREAANGTPGEAVCFVDGAFFLGPVVLDSSDRSFVYWRGPLAGELDATYLPIDPAARMGTKLADKFNSLWGFAPSTSASIADALALLLTDHSSPDGATGPKPLTLNSRKQLVASIGGIRLPLPAKPTATHLAKIQDSIRAAKEADIANALEQDDTEATRKWLYNELVKFGVSVRDVENWTDTAKTAAKRMLPEKYASLVDDGTLQPIKPTTLIGDTMVDTDTTAMASHTATGTGGGFSWTQLAGSETIVSNTCENQSAAATHTLLRADSDLSTDDHYAQMDVVRIDEDATVNFTSGAMAVARKDSTATQTFYAADVNNNSGSEFVRLFEVTAGTFAQLGSNIGFTWSLPDTIQCHCDGSTIRAILNGSEIISVSDSSITTHLRTGIRLRHGSSFTLKTRVDNFVAEDIVAATHRQSMALLGVGA